MKRLSILIADRTPEYCAHLARWLHDHDTTCVHSPAEGMSAAVLLHFDLIVKATTEGDRSGLEEMRALKRRQPWARVLAVVGGTDDESTQREFNQALRAGADAAVRRTIEERQFRLALRACWHDVMPGAETTGPRRSFTLSRV